MNIFIRQVQQNDINTIFKFICELEQQSFEFEVFQRFYGKNIVNPDYAYYIAIVDNSPVGFISIHTQYLLHHCGKVGEIQEFYVAPQYRNQGIGKVLIQEIFAWACKNDITNIEVTSNKLRSGIAEMYQHFGFRLTHDKLTMSVLQ